MNGREQESTRVEQATTIAKERALEVEEEDKILAKKVGKEKETGREEREKTIVKNAGKHNERARMNRQRQREREIQRQRERQENNDMMTESVVLMSLWPRTVNILISN